MIISLTLNPSIDYLYQTDSFHIGKLNRMKSPKRMVGGKGINAGRTASILGSKVWSTGIIAGITGDLISSLLKKEKFKKDFIGIDGESRNAITIMHDEGIQTEIVEEGPYIDSVIEKKIIKKIIKKDKNDSSVKIICLCGSVNSKNDKLYHDLLIKLKNEIKNDVKILVDISGKQLINMLQSEVKPYFIKPNIHEFSQALGIKIHTKNEIVQNLKSSILFDGIPLIIISCGEEGAIAKFKNNIYDLEIPKIKLVNPTGSGDATVGGVAYALDQKMSVENILKYGMASGVANAMEEGVGVVNRENVKNIKEQIKINLV